jgi:catalase
MSAKTASITFARCTALLAGISSLATAAAAQQLAPQEAQVASRMQTAERVEVVPMSVIETPTGAAPIYRRDNGAPVGDNRNSKTAGDMGPVLLEDAHLIEKLARFDRERVPERVVHARGTGAKGMFRATADISDYSMASLFQPGKETPVFVRFSSVIHGHLSPEYLRDPHGFATKFYTDEGNWDLVGNNLPVFFIRDAMQFPDMVHSLKPDPVTNRQDPNRFFDFFSHVPEATNMLTHLYTNLGTPASYREMDGNGVHAFRLVNDEGEQVFAKFRWISDQGVKNYTAAQAKEAGFNYLTDDLYGAISRGNHPSWNLMMQVLPVAEIGSLDYNPFDDTKEWLDRPWMKIGEMTLDEVPENFFEWTEQSAFAPSNMVPGIEPSPDRMLQGRLFS